MGENMKKQIEDLIELGDRKCTLLWKEHNNDSLWGAYRDSRQLPQTYREMYDSFAEHLKLIAPLLAVDQAPLAAELIKFSEMSFLYAGNEHLAWRDSIRPQLQVLAMRPDEAISDLVTLDQVAPLCGLAKRTLDNHRMDGILPRPDIKGGGGKSHKWYWHNLRPHLEKVSTKLLPEKFPGSVFASES